MRKLSFILICFTIFSCSKNDNSNQNQQGDWLVDEADITGLLSLYPLVLNPEFTSISNSSLDDNAMVGVVSFGSEIRVYPYSSMSAVEIVNDEYNGQKYAFSYCPLTKSSLAFTRDQVFRASGYLFKNNLTPWDEATESIWSQMLIKGIRGDQANRRFNTIPVLETTWKTVRENFPTAKVVSNLSSSRIEQEIDDIHNFSFYRETPPPDDDNLDNNNDNVPEFGELTYGILDGFSSISIFRYNDFSNSNIINVTIRSQDYVVYGNSSKRVINAFKVSNNQNYQALENEFPFVIKDNNGVKYDILGRGTNGTTLEKPQYAYVAIWNAWDDFYDNFTFQ